MRPLAVITGASAGLGEAFARAYAARGFDLLITARRRDRLEALAGELQTRHGVEVAVVPADLARFEGHLPILEALEGRAVDVLVNNAGFGIAQDFVGTDWGRQRDFLMTLVVSGCGLAHGLIPGMIAQRSGAIINVASVAGFAPGAAGHTLYPGAKSLAIKFSQGLDAELREHGIRVTAICPGPTRTEFQAANGTEHLNSSTPRFLIQSAQAVVEAAITANAAGKVVVVPGLFNQIAALLMTYLPAPWVRPIVQAGARQYRLKD